MHGLSKGQRSFSMLLPIERRVSPWPKSVRGLIDIGKGRNPSPWMQRQVVYRTSGVQVEPKESLYGGS